MILNPKCKMKILSTFGEVENTGKIIVNSVKCYKNDGGKSEISTYENNGDYFTKSLLPGDSFLVEISVDLQNIITKENQTIIVNWICDATKVRGALFPGNDSNTFKGNVDGDKVRESILFTPLLLDAEGRIIKSGEKVKMWLEGKNAFFPVRSVEQSGSREYNFVYLEYDRLAGANAILSKECVQAVFNVKSIFCDEKKGGPLDGAPQYFSLYEVWRQFIEVIMYDETVQDFDFGENKLDTRLIVIVSRVLRDIFPDRSYEELKSYRAQKYPDFCSSIQNYFFQRCR